MNSDDRSLVARDRDRIKSEWPELDLDLWPSLT
jgi:hypothetical protein